MFVSVCLCEREKEREKEKERERGFPYVCIEKRFVCIGLLIFFPRMKVSKQAALFYGILNFFL